MASSGCGAGGFAARTGNGEEQDFATVRDRLEQVVVAACAAQQAAWPEGHAGWPAGVAAAIRAALEFAMADPAAARILTVDATTRRLDGGRAYLEMVERFAELLGARAPRDDRIHVSTDKAIMARIWRQVANELEQAGSDELLRIAPDLVQLALLPYLGFSEAKRWAESAN